MGLSKFKDEIGKGNNLDSFAIWLLLIWLLLEVTIKDKDFRFVVPLFVAAYFEPLNI